MSRRSFPAHRTYVRTWGCLVCGGPSECCHLRTAGNAGTGYKPPDWFCVPLCRDHHAEQEGRTSLFERKYGIDLWGMAAHLAATSPDLKMKEAMNV